MNITDFYIFEIYADVIIFGGHGWACTQNDKYAASLQYVKKELSYEVEVLHADKHGNISKVDTVIFVGFGQVCPKYLGRFAISLWHFKKEVRNEGRGLTAQTGSKSALTINYSSNVLKLW